MTPTFLPLWTASHTDRCENLIHISPPSYYLLGPSEDNGRLIKWLPADWTWPAARRLRGGVRPPTRRAQRGCVSSAPAGGRRPSNLRVPLINPRLLTRLLLWTKDEWLVGSWTISRTIHQGVSTCGSTGTGLSVPESRPHCLYKCRLIFKANGR